MGQREREREEMKTRNGEWMNYKVHTCNWFFLCFRKKIGDIFFANKNRYCMSHTHTHTHSLHTGCCGGGNCRPNVEKFWKNYVFFLFWPPIRTCYRLRTLLQVFAINIGALTIGELERCDNVHMTNGKSKEKFTQIPFFFLEMRKISGLLVLPAPVRWNRSNHPDPI